jgi:hypothetical protein
MTENLPFAIEGIIPARDLMHQLGDVQVPNWEVYNQLTQR